MYKFRQNLKKSNYVLNGIITRSKIILYFLLFKNDNTYYLRVNTDVQSLSKRNQFLYIYFWLENMGILKYLKINSDFVDMPFWLQGIRDFVVRSWFFLAFKKEIHQSSVVIIVWSQMVSDPLGIGDETRRLRKSFQSQSCTKVIEFDKNLLQSNLHH